MQHAGVWTSASVQEFPDVSIVGQVPAVMVAYSIATDVGVQCVRMRRHKDEIRTRVYVEGAHGRMIRKLSRNHVMYLHLSDETKASPRLPVKCHAMTHGHAPPNEGDGEHSHHFPSGESLVFKDNLPE